MAAAPQLLARRQTQLQVAGAPTNTPLSSRRALRHGKVADDPVLFAGALARLLANAESEQRAHHAESDVPNEAASRGRHLRRLATGLTEKPPQSCASRLGEGLVVRLLIERLRAAPEVRLEAGARSSSTCSASALGCGPRTFSDFFSLAAEQLDVPAAKRAPQHRVRSGRSNGAVWSALTGGRSPKNVPLDPVRRQVDHGGHDGALPVDSRVRHSVELGESRVTWASHAIATGSAGIEKNHDIRPKVLRHIARRKIRTHRTK